jgi:hypothetical protein
MSIVIYGDLDKARVLLADMVSQDVAHKITKETLVLELPGFTVYLRDSLDEIPQAETATITRSLDDMYVCENIRYRHTVSKDLILPQLAKMDETMTPELARKVTDTLVSDYLDEANSKRIRVDSKMKQLQLTIARERRDIENKETLCSVLFGIIGGIFGFSQTDNLNISAAFGIVFFLVALIQFALTRAPIKKPEYKPNIHPEVRAILDKMYSCSGIPNKPKKLRMITKEDLENDCLTLDCIYHDEIAEQLAHSSSFDLD